MIAPMTSEIVTVIANIALALSLVVGLVFGIAKVRAAARDRRDLVDKTLGSFVTTAWGKYKAAFLDVCKTAPDPYVGEYFQWLSERIDQSMTKDPRKPFFETHASTRHRK